MEVTKNNFEEVFPDLVKDIESATFLCIDGEFTGLNNGHNVTAFDTPSESYQKIRAGSLDFLFIQFGLSIFTQDKKTGRYRNKTYVFYLFPRPHSRLAPDARFLCQTSSIDFLVSNNFDFNKLFREGIPYMNASDESSFSEALEIKRIYQAERQKEPSASQPIPVPKQFKPVIDTAMEKIENVINGSETEVKLEKCSGFVRKLIYQSYEERYGSQKGIILKTENGVMICRRGEEEAQEEKDAKILAAAVGFSRVIREISSRGKLVVGHNMLLDLCHLVHRFLDPLPSDYHLFKEMAHSLFPNIIDTKMMCTEEVIRQQVTSTTLEGLMETLSKPPFHLPKIDETEGYGYSTVNGQYHDAGYDAFVTGKVFLALVRALDPDNKYCCIENCKPIEKYMNKLFLMKAPDTCIDLVNADPEPRRDHVFHLSFPSSWTTNHIIKMFSPFGSVQLYWLSDTTAWVSLYQKEESTRVLQTFQYTTPPGVTVISYYRYLQEKGAATSPRPNKRKSTDFDTSIIDKKRKSSTSRNSSIRRISPIREESPTATKSPKDSEIKLLEEAASFGNEEFGKSSLWD